jgi:serralysin
LPAVSSVSPSGISYIDWLESGLKWASGDFTYSFPTSASFYTGFGGGAYGSGEPSNGFKAFTAVQQAATTSILNMYAQVANVTFTLITESTTQSATLRYAESNSPSTAWGYYPSTMPEGGDAWFNNSSHWYDNPVVGNYAWLTIIHETGHLLGLKHPQDISGSFAAAPVSADSLEYTVMSYRSYIGASTTQGLTNATWSFPQTLMMYDISALQYMYGANYNTNNGNTVYKWNPATGQETINGVAQAAPGGNTIFSTVWDGGGSDTYDFSNYTTNVTVSLQPGTWTTVSSTQLANLGGGHYAAGNIANAYMFNNNPASLIENAVGGTGADGITGNTANNKLTGGAGSDTLDGVSGTDTAVYSGAWSSYQITQNVDGSWKVVDLRAGSPDGTDTLKNIDFLQFSDVTVAVGATPPPLLQAPVISTVTPDTASPTDGITSANVLTLAGTAPANATVKVYDGANLLGTVVAGANGSWSLPTSALIDGNHSFTATATDASGNTSAVSAVKTVIVDTAAPVGPTVVLQSVDSGVAGDNVTNVKAASLGGVAEANSTVKLYDGGTLIATVVAGTNGNWSFTTTALTDGVHNFTGTATDAAGNVSAAAARNVTIDTVAPNAPIITGNAIVNTNHVQLAGSAEAGSTVKLLDGSTVLGTTTANGSGAWSFTTGVLADGVHAVTATATDVAGNAGTASQAVNAVVGTPVAIDSYGSISLTALGNKYYFFSGGSPGPALKYGGVDVVAGQFSGWSPLGAEQTATGYQVAWKNTNGTFAVWTTDSSGNYKSDPGIVSGTSTTVLSAETTLQQDLNGDGVIGATPPPPPPSGTVIESYGSTSLTAVGTKYYLYDSGGTGPALKYGGVDVVAGQFSGWSPLGAEQTATGYQVAWKNTNGTFAVWTTDSNGNYKTDPGIVSGTSSTVMSAETTLQQDLNGDGTIGATLQPPPPPPPPSGTVIESYGSTSLTAVGTKYYLYDSGGTGPALKYGGADVVAGQFSGWSPLGAEQTATGYQVAWKNTNGTFAVWTTDSSGNYKSDPGIVSGTSTTVMSTETVLQQDLNGDGVIGATPPPPPPSGTVIESYGVTSLTAVGSKYYLYDSGGTGPALKYGGADVVAGQFSGWSPLGAEQTATGYQMAWKHSTGVFSIWTTDSNGNYKSDPGILSGTSATVKMAETTFHQDLNGDGVIGGAAATPAAIVSGTAGNDTLTSTAANEVLFGNGGNNTFVFAGNFGKDTVADFHAADDVLQFSRTAFTDFADVLAHAAQAGADVTLTVDAAHSVTVSNTMLSQLDPYNVHLV